MRLYTTAELAALSPNIMQRSFSANLMRIQPNGASPLLGLSGMARERRITAIAHSYYSKRHLFPQVVASGAQTSGADPVVVDDTSDMKAGTILLNYLITPGVFTAPELIRVDAVTNSTDLDVSRGYAGTTPAAIADNAVLIEVGTAYEEGSAAPIARAVTMTEHTNFTQIFRNTWDVTETASAVSLEPGVELMSENKEDASFLHGQAIEWSAIFGRKDATTLNGRPLRTMDGIESIITQFAPGNINAAGATTTFKQLEAMLHPTLDNVVIGRGGTGKKLLMCGRQAVQTINEIGRASGFFELERSQTNFGMTFSTFQTARGSFELIEHPLLNSNPNTVGMAIITDLASFDFLNLRPTMHKDIDMVGVDAQSGVYTTELSLEMTNPLAWGIIYGLTAGA